ADLLRRHLHVSLLSGTAAESAARVPPRSCGFPRASRAAWLSGTGGGVSRDSGPGEAPWKGVTARVGVGAVLRNAKGARRRARAERLPDEPTRDVDEE